MNDSTRALRVVLRGFKAVTYSTATPLDIDQFMTVKELIKSPRFKILKSPTHISGPLNFRSLYAERL